MHPERPNWDQLCAIHPVSRETQQRLECFVELLVQWQSKTNLIANSTVQHIWSRHIADSLQCIALYPDKRAWLDLGSGGGFPGMVIGILMAEYEDAMVCLVESIAKKCAFLRKVARETASPCIIQQCRIESIPKQPVLLKNGERFVPEIITARALASLPQLLVWIEPLVTDETVCCLHKGRGYEQELQDCRGLWHFDLVEHRSAIESDSVLLEISNLRSSTE